MNTMPAETILRGGSKEAPGTCPGKLAKVSGWHPQLRGWCPPVANPGSATDPVSPTESSKCTNNKNAYQHCVTLHLIVCFNYRPHPKARSGWGVPQVEGIQGTARPGQDRGTPGVGYLEYPPGPDQDRGYPRSGGTWGPPEPGQDGGLPQPGEYPGYLPGTRSGWGGYPRQGGTQGTPPPPGQDSTWSTWYATVGMPLAFTQEDFLV